MFMLFRRGTSAANSYRARTAPLHSAQTRAIRIPLELRQRSLFLRQMATALKDYTPFFSQRTKLRKPSPIRELMPLLSIPGMISLGGGLPNPSLFPFGTISIKLYTGETIEIDGKLLNTALQYSPSYGLPDLLELIKKDMSRLHSRPVDDSQWLVCVTTGSSDGISKAFDVLLDDGEHLLIENPTYPGTVTALQGYSAKLVGVAVDANGIIPSSLKQILANWDSTHPGVKKPRLLYTIPTGQNPSGATLSLERRKEVYQLAQEHNLLILEDDPYWFLRLKPYKGQEKQADELKSFFSMDVDGRVVRFDSYSKVASSGLRIGCVSGPKAIIEKVQIVQQATCLHPSGVSQAMLVALLNKWGQKGWDEHIGRVQDFYTERRNVFLGLAEKHLTGLAEWWVPSAGMFVWFKLLGIEDTSKLISEKAIKAKVLMVPGKSCAVDGKPSSYVRAAFSTASNEEMEEALKRLATMLKEEKSQ